MKFSGRSLTDAERVILLELALSNGANRCCVGVEKVENERFVPVVRFFNDDSFLFSVELSYIESLSKNPS